MVAYGTVDDLMLRLEAEAILTPERRVMYAEILDAISRKIDAFCRRPDGFVATAPTERLFLGSGESFQKIPECTSISSVAVKPNPVVKDYVLWKAPSTPWAGDGDWIPVAGTPSRPIFYRIPYNMIIADPNGAYARFTFSHSGRYPTVKIVATWGASDTVPPPIREATLAEALILIKRYQGGMDSGLSSPELGVIAMRVRQSSLSKDVQDLLVNGGWVLPLYAGEY